VHAPGYPPSKDPAQVRAAVRRLGIEHPVVLDTEFALWREYGNEGWPARYLFDRSLHLHSFHYGEGAYDETEAEIAELTGVESTRRESFPADGALVVPTPEQAGAWSGPYEAGAVWAVLEPAATAACKPPRLRVNGAEIAVPHAGCFALVEHERHSAGVLELELGTDVTCHAIQFTAGLA
jgi:hypothetical protein